MGECSYLICFQIDKYIFILDVAMQNANFEAVLNATVDLLDNLRRVYLGETADFLRRFEQIHHDGLMLHDQDV